MTSTKTKLKTTRTNKSQKSKLAQNHEVPLAFIEHLHILRKHVLRVVASIAIFSTAAYFVQQHIVNYLLAPAHGQHFIYTSPGGGINFLFTVCSYVGIILSMPVLVYSLLSFLSPLIDGKTRKVLIKYCYLSCVLGVMGFSFGYYIGLPAALHFLSNQFTNNQVGALFTIQEYLSFLMVYLFGFVLVFQIPVIIAFINRVKPLTPSGLFKGERYVIAGSVIAAMIMAPTPNPIDQLIIAIPIIIIYNLSIVMIKVVNKPSGSIQPHPMTELVGRCAIKLSSRNIDAPVASVKKAPPRMQMASPRGMIMDIIPRNALQSRA